MQLKGKKILFATTGQDGHINPLTGLAKFLQGEGCDVRWYTSPYFKKKMEKLEIPFYPFETVQEIDLNDPAQAEARNAIDDPIEKLNYDFIHVFIERGPEYYADVLKIYESFAFDVLICENGFTAIPFIRQKMNMPVVMVGIIPLPENSVHTGPYGMALPPANDEASLANYAAQNDFALNVLFKQTVEVHERTLNAEGIKFERALFFDLLIKQSDFCLQIGIPEFEYYRSDLGANVKFIGALLPYQDNSKNYRTWSDERLKQYSKIVLLTQGTVEKDSRKLIEPALEAFKDTDVLVIVTTAGSNTQALREKYQANNIIIEDFIPFNDVMPYANVYVTNGGYGGTLLSLSHKLPMVAAGVHEGKSEVCARIGHFGAGINLNTETPTAEAIRVAVEEILQNNHYKNKAAELCDEMAKYQSIQLCADYISDLLTAKIAQEATQFSL